MINHILLPLDLTEYPESLIRNAVGLAKKCSAKLSLLHIFNLPQPSGMNSAEAGTLPVQPYDHYLDTEMMANERKLIDEEAGKIKTRIPELNEIESEVITSLGLVVEEVTDYASKNGIDLIVMETSGASGFKEIFVGTHSEETTRKAPCPVLVFPDQHKKFHLRTLCMAVDNQINDSRESLALFKEIAAVYSADIRVVHVEEKPEKTSENAELEKNVEKALSGASFSFTVIKGGNVEENLYKFCQENDIDLLALVYHKQNLLDRILKKSLTTNVAYHSDIPFLVLK